MSLTVGIACAVSELDLTKEQLAYLRFWQVIMAVLDVILIGWLASASQTATPGLLTVALVGIVALSVGVFLLHRQIKQRIELVGRL